MTDSKKKKCEPNMNFKNEVERYIENHRTEFDANFLKYYEEFATNFEGMSYGRMFMNKDHITEFLSHLKLYSRAQHTTNKPYCYTILYKEVGSKNMMSKSDDENHEIVMQKSSVGQKSRAKKPFDKRVILREITFCGYKCDKSVEELYSIFYDFLGLEITGSHYFTISTYFFLIFTPKEIEFKNLMDLTEKLEIAILHRELLTKVEDLSKMMFLT